jgi:hypothetical protein
VERLKIEKRGSGAEMDVDGRWVPVSTESVVSMNMWGFTPSVFPHIERVFRKFLETQASSPKSECYIPGAVDDLIQSGQADVEVASSPSLWLGMTYPEDKPAVKAGIQRLIDAGEYPRKLWS